MLKKIIICTTTIVAATYFLSANAEQSTSSAATATAPAQAQSDATPAKTDAPKKHKMHLASHHDNRAHWRAQAHTKMKDSKSTHPEHSIQNQ